MSPPPPRLANPEFATEMYYNYQKFKFINYILKFNLIKNTSTGQNCCAHFFQTNFILVAFCNLFTNMSAVVLSLGHGNYFAVSAATASLFSVKDADGNKYIFVCKVYFLFYLQSSYIKFDDVTITCLLYMCCRFSSEITREGIRRCVVRPPSFRQTVATRCTTRCVTTGKSRLSL